MQDCKLFVGYHTPSGYGQQYYAPTARKEYVHRIVWLKRYGSIPLGLWVLHTCDVRDCIQDEGEGTYTLDGVEHPRLGHLWLGTVMDNTRDMILKGRQQHSMGIDHPRAKLSEAEVLDVRARYRQNETQTQIAERYAVSRSLIGHIVFRRVWKHI